MDLNTALNLQQCGVDLSHYQDYQSRDLHSFQLNDSVRNRTFDIHPERVQYQKNITGPTNHLLRPTYECRNTLGPIDATHQLRLRSSSPGLQQHAFPQPMESDQSYFPITQVNEPCQPSQPMSASFMQMKHAQEKQTLMERSDSNSSSVDNLKIFQAKDLQNRLQNQQHFVNGPQGLYSNAGIQYANNTTIPDIQKTYAFDAQGQTVEDKQTLFPEKMNKYQMLKRMSPQMLNQLYGRESDQSVLPPGAPAEDGDIYTLTSMKTPIEPPKMGCDQLRHKLKNRETQIMHQQSQKGIQSYQSYNGSGTLIDDAFR